MLSDVPPRVLADLCRTHGRELLLEQGRCRSLLADLCGGYRTEVYLLDCIARERLIAPVLSFGMPVDFAVSQLASQIVQVLRIDPNTARWAAEAWAAAMDWAGDAKVSKKKTFVKSDTAAPADSHAQRVLIQGILRAFRGMLGEVGIGPNLDKVLCESVSGVDHAPGRSGDDAKPWGTVRFLAFTRRSTGLVITDSAIHFLNPTASNGIHSGTWALSRLQEVGAHRSGMQEISLSDSDDRMSLEATGVPVATMLLFLDLIREVVGPFLTDYVLPDPSPSAKPTPASRRRAKK